MKMKTRQKLRDGLEKLEPLVQLPKDIQERAEAPFLKLLEQSK